MHRLLFVLVWIASACRAPSPATPTELRPTAKIRRPLRVVLYPFVPAKDELFHRVERTFEESAAGAEIDVQIIDLSANYYDPGDAGAVEKTDADVYELDAVFIADFIANGKIRDLPADLIPAPADYVPGALAPVTTAGKVYGIPHWLCGNFLFSHKSEPRLANVESLAALGAVVEKGGLLVDMKGSSTLGELYLDAAIGIHGSFSAAIPHLDAGKIGQDATLGVLQKLLGWCPRGFCRSRNYHDRQGFYARQFARRRATAYVGYSESLHYLGTEARQSCAVEDKCVTEQEIQVSGLPFATAVHSVGWTDVLTFDADCTGQCEADARAFIKFYESDETTLALLIPGWNQAPRYLLPARKAFYTDKRLLAAAPLYPRLLELMSKTEIVTAPALNERLRKIGAAIDDRSKLHDNAIVTPPKPAPRLQSGIARQVE